MTHALRGEERDAADGRTEGAKAHLQPIIIQVGRKCCDHMHGGEAGGGGGEGGEGMEQHRPTQTPMTGGKREMYL